MASPALQRSPLIYKQLEEEATAMGRGKERFTSVGSYQAVGGAQMAKSLEIESNLGAKIGGDSNKDKKNKKNKK